MPEAVERPPRRDDTVADTGTLVRLGRQDPPPKPRPATQPFQEPVYPGMPHGWTTDDTA